MKAEKKTEINGSTLKLIALCTMFIDHIGAALLENGLLPQIAGSVLAGKSFDYLPTDYYTWFHIDTVLRLIGRLAFPLYCFLLVEGFLHTRNVAKYTLRLGIFALISEIPFDLAFYHSIFNLKSQNVFFTLLIGLVVLWCMRYFEQLPPHLAPFRYLVAMTGIMVAEFLQTDYAGFGVMLIVLLYILHQNRKLQCIFGALFMFLQSYTAPLAFLLVYFYNGERGKQLPKYFFYLFYPVHLLLLILLRTFLL